MKTLPLLSLLGFALSVSADAPRALPAGQLPNDARLQPLKDLDGYFPFTPPPNVEQWNTRAERVRRQILVSQGLWPQPTKTPLKPVIHGKIEREDYTVENVFFESMPGFYVTGSLYRPKGKTGRVPGILSPHGHWAQGRFYDNAARIAQEIVQGAERFEEGGRSPLQARAVQLARMGCVVFHYDMIGYADSQQISYAIAHRFAKQRPEMNALENWGLFSPQAEANLQNVMGLQTWSSIRALDFLLELPDVDPARIGVTGASGGGTQTFILCAIDHRPALSFPTVMVSTAMQGGCTCENASLLRVNTGNIEFAALVAPRPQGLTAANDWTREMETKGFPELKAHYQLLGAPGNVMLKPLVHFGHNYNYVSRAAMYSWVNQHFKLRLKEPIVEQDYRRLSTNEMTVWNAQYPPPPGGPDFERQLLRWWKEDSEKQLAQARQSPSEFRKIYGGALEVTIGRTFAEVGELEWNLSKKADQGRYLEMNGSVRNLTHQEELPSVFLYPKQWNRRVVVWIDEQGKAGLYQPDGAIKPEIEQLLNSGATVVGVDLLFQGEFLADGQAVTQTRRVKNPREFAGYTFGYNHALFAQRVHDIMTIVKFARQPHQNQPDTMAVDLVGLGGAGPWVAAARALAGDAVAGAAIDTGGFRFGKLTDIHEVNFLPGGAKYGDLPGMLALGAPGKLWLAGEGKAAPEIVQAAYQRNGASLTAFDGKPDDVRNAATRWLLQAQ